MLQAGETGVTPSASETRPARPHGWTLPPMQHHRQSITSMLQRKWRGDILISPPGSHNTIQKLVPSPLRERDKRQPHQPQTQQASSIDSNSQPMRTAHLASRPSGKLVSASNASENTTLAKARDKILIPTLKYIRNQLKDTTATRQRDRNMEETNGSGHKIARQAAPGTKMSQNHNTTLKTPGHTQATATAQYTHSTMLKSSNGPIDAARRRQGQQLYIHGMTRPAGGLKLGHHSHRHRLARTPSHNHQRCRRRQGHVSTRQTWPNSQREIRSS